MIHFLAGGIEFCDACKRQFMEQQADTYFVPDADSWVCIDGEKCGKVEPSLRAVRFYWQRDPAIEEVIDAAATQPDLPHVVEASRHGG